MKCGSMLKIGRIKNVLSANAIFKAVTAMRSPYFFAVKTISFFNPTIQKFAGYF